MEEMGMTNKQFSGFVRLIMKAIKNAMEKIPEEYTCSARYKSPDGTSMPPGLFTTPLLLSDAAAPSGSCPDRTTGSDRLCRYTPPARQ